MRKNIPANTGKKKYTRINFIPHFHAKKQKLSHLFMRTFQKHCKTCPPHFQFQFNSGTLENVQNLPLKFILIPMQADEQNQLL